VSFFANRLDAGKQLAQALTRFKGEDVIVLSIPRGGVIVGFEVARALGARLDIIVPRKIGAPDNPELAIGAVTEDGTAILNDSLVSELGVSERFIREESVKQREEIVRRLKSYRGDAPYPGLKNRVVIVVDDGIATGYTMKAALASVRKKGAKSVVVAIPVGPPSTIRELGRIADHVVCLYTPEIFYAIGQFYDDFSQTTDDEVKKLIRRSQNQQRTHLVREV
jgi:putative phosphoribosyl transferase